jgi:hypothetical protein
MSNNTGSFIKNNFKTYPVPRTIPEVLIASDIKTDPESIETMIAEFSKLKPEEKLTVEEDLIPAEIKMISKIMGRPLSDAEIDEILREADLDGDGSISRVEFEKYFPN